MYIRTVNTPWLMYNTTYCTYTTTRTAVTDHLVQRAEAQVWCSHIRMYTVLHSVHCARVCAHLCSVCCTQYVHSVCDVCVTCREPLTPLRYGYSKSMPFCFNPLANKSNRETHYSKQASRGMDARTIQRRLHCTDMHVQSGCQVLSATHSASKCWNAENK